MDTTLTAEEPSKSHSWTLQRLSTLFQVQSNHHLMELCKTASEVKPIGTTNRAASPKLNVELRLPDRCPDDQGTSTASGLKEAATAGSEAATRSQHRPGPPQKAQLPSRMHAAA